MESAGSPSNDNAAPCGLSTEILTQIFAHFENRAPGTLAAISQCCRQFQAIALPFLYGEFLVPSKNKQFAPDHMNALIAQNNPGIKAIRILYFVPFWKKLKAKYEGQELNKTQAESEDLFRNFVVNLDPEQLKEIHFDMACEEVPAGLGTLNLLSITQSNLESFSITHDSNTWLMNDEGLMMYPVMPPFRKLKYLGIFGLASRSLHEIYWEWANANCKTLERLDYLTTQGGGNVDLDKYKDESMRMPFRCEKLQEIRVRSEIYDQWRFPLRYVALVGNKDNCRHMSCSPYGLEYNIDLMKSYINGRVNLTSLELKCVYKMKLEDVIPFLRPLENLKIEFEFREQEKPDPSFVGHHKESLRRFSISMNHAVAIESLNQEYAFWEWPKLEELSIKTQSAKKNPEKFKLPPRLKALHLPQEPGLDDEEDENDEEYTRSTPLVPTDFLQAMPNLEFTLEEGNLTEKPRMRVLIIGSNRDAIGEPFIYFKPCYRQDGTLELWKPVDIVDIHDLNPEIKLIGEELWLTRWSFPDVYFSSGLPP